MAAVGYAEDGTSSAELKDPHVSGPYVPPRPHRNQAARTRGGSPAGRWRWWWLTPALGLIPLLVVVLAAQGAFAPRQAAPPVAAPAASTTPVTVPTSATETAASAAQTASTTSAASSPTTAPNATPAATTSTTGAATSTTAASSTAPTAASTASGASTSATNTSSETGASTGQPFVAYHVQSGDTLRFIAQTYGVSVASIAQASGVRNPDVLRVGQVLTIPSQPGWLYRVQPGETLDQIAARSGVSSQQIASASGMAEASIHAGEVVLIPEALVSAQISK
jgi:LysM repeat protein